mgnify:CR=1 FL=1
MKFLKALAMWLLQAIIGLVFMGFVGLMMAEWMAGCGESYIDARGIRHQNECLFLNRAKETP